MGGAVDAARRISSLDRRACRAAFERRFTARRMAQCYLDVYAALSGARDTDESEPDAASDLPIAD